MKYQGILFDSQLERDYYIELLRMKRKGEIKDIELQPKWELIPTFKSHGKTHRKTTYSADFTITYSDDTKEVVDVKGHQTEVFRIKRKLYEYQNPDIDFYLVTRDKNGVWEKKK